MILASPGPSAGAFFLSGRTSAVRLDPAQGGGLPKCHARFSFRERRMSFRTILVCQNPASANEHSLRLTGELAAELGARVIGCAARRPFPATYSENFAAVTHE